jgi:hypothetical protein
MSKLLAFFKIEDRHVEVWEKTNDDINPEDGDAIQKAILAVMSKHFGNLSPDALDTQIKHLVRMAQGWSNTTMALIPFIHEHVKPTQLAEFLGVLFTQMVDDEYDYLRKWEELTNGPERTDQEVHQGQGDQAQGPDRTGSEDGA